LNIFFLLDLLFKEMTTAYQILITNLAHEYHKKQNDKQWAEGLIAKCVMEGNASRDRIELLKKDLMYNQDIYSLLQTTYKKVSNEILTFHEGDNSDINLLNELETSSVKVLELLNKSRLTIHQIKQELNTILY